MRCPRGHLSVAWPETRDPYGHAVITTRFNSATCRAQCTRSIQGPQRFTLRPPPQHRALRAARAGVEGLLSQGVRAFALPAARYLGLAKTQIQHLLTIAALNLARLDAWLTNRSRAATRPNRLAALLAQPPATAPLP